MAHTYLTSVPGRHCSQCLVAFVRRGLFSSSNSEGTEVSFEQVQRRQQRRQFSSISDDKLVMRVTSSSQCLVRRSLHTSSPSSSFKNMEDKELESAQKSDMQSWELFQSAQEKNKDSFKKALELFTQRDVRRRGAVEFIRAALKNMRQFGVHRDLETYRSMIDILPKGKYVPENMWQAQFGHFPKQQDCIVQVLAQMNQYKVVPDIALGHLIENIFGMDSDPYKMYMRMMYWMPKFKNLSPWPLPHDVPNDTLELAKLAVAQITSVDRLTEIKVYKCEEEVPDSVDKTWIVSGQSPEQRDMISKLPKDKALFVEGAFRVWLRSSQVNYFVLRGDPLPRPPPPKGDLDDVSKIKNWTLGEFDDDDLVRLPNKHEQEDGTILACCATGTSSKDSLLSWVRLLQRENPDLEGIPVLFVVSSPLGQVVPTDGGERTELA